MPDFVKEGESKIDDTIKEVPNSNIYVESSVRDYQEEIEAPRKTLHDQLQEHREKKQLEFEKQMESRNSSYKLDEASASFYESLRKKAHGEEVANRRDEEEQLAKFRIRKAQVQVSKPTTTPTVSYTAPPNIAKLSKKRPSTIAYHEPNKKTSTAKPSPSDTRTVSSIIGDYSSDDD